MHGTRCPSVLLRPSHQSCPIIADSNTFNFRIEREPESAPALSDVLSERAPRDAALSCVPSVEPPSAEPPAPDVHRTVYLVDAYSLIFQVFHALPEMTSPSGQPVAAVHGFTRDLIDLLEKKKPDYLFCAFDVPGPTFRDELYPEYKAGRKEMPADLQLQVAPIRRMLDALGIPVLELPGYEADDVLATVARRAEQAGFDCVLVTSDKDCRQLISERVRMYNIRKDQVFDCGGTASGLGNSPGSGSRLPGPGRRFGRQCSRRPADRTEDRQ